MSDDGLRIVASSLRPEEAGMLEGLLRSAGIQASVRDGMLSGIHPFLMGVIGGAKVVVPAADAERARAIIASAGVLPGGALREEMEIPEEEWSRPEGHAGGGADDEPPPAEFMPERPPDGSPEGLARRALGCAAAGIAFPPLNLFSLYLAWRFFTALGQERSRVAKTRIAAALLLDAASLAYWGSRLYALLHRAA
jgi:hypothetical protein